MTTYRSLSGVWNKAEKAIMQSRTPAAKKAATSTRAKLAKDVKDQIGLASAKTRARTKIFSADTKGVLLSIGTRFLIAIQEFKPKALPVKTDKGMRTGVTYQIKGQSRTIAPKAWLAYGKNSNKKIVIERKGTERYPTKTSTTTVFLDTVRKMKDDLQRHMVDAYKKNFSSEFNFRIGKK